MIIKSLSRKKPTFHQLIKYLNEKQKHLHPDSHEGILTHNLYGNNEQLQTLIQEFYDNAKHIKQRKNGNYLYHEILSLPDHKESSAQDLLDFATQYLKHRAINAIAYGRVHLDTDNPHIHLVISANEIGVSKKLRITRAKLEQAKKRVRTMAIERGYKNGLAINDLEKELEQTPPLPSISTLERRKIKNKRQRQTRTRILRKIKYRHVKMRTRNKIRQVSGIARTIRL